MFTFFVKNLELIKQLSPGYTKIYNMIFKCCGFSVTPIGDSSLMKLAKFFTSFFFNAKKGVNGSQNLIKSIRSKRPYDHRIVPRASGLSVNNRTPESFQEPWENRVFGVSNFKGNNPIFASSFALRFPMLNSETSFSINQSGKIGQIGSGRDFYFLNILERLEIFFVNAIVHMDFLFYLVNKLFSIFMGFWRNSFAFIADSFRDFLNQRATNDRRFMFEDKIGKARFKYFMTTLSFDIPQPTIFSVRSFFRSLMDSSSKFINKILAYLFIYRANLNRRFVDLSRWFLNVVTAINRAVSVNVTGQVCKFHLMNFTDKLNYWQHPQRLTGLDSYKKEYVIV